MSRRGNREGSVYQDRDLRWRASLWLGYRRGKPHRKVFSGATRQEAADKLKAAFAHEKQLAALTDPERQNVGQYLARWLADCALRVRKPGDRDHDGLSPRTMDFYRNMVDSHLEPALGRIRLAALKGQDIQQLIDDLAKKSPSTVSHVRATLRTALNAAVPHLILSNPVNQTRLRRKVSVSGGRAMSAEQAQAFIEAARGHHREAFFVLAICTGLSQGEIIGLPWSAVDLEAAKIRIHQAVQRVDRKLTIVDTKTKSRRREIYVPEPALSLLRDLPRDHELVFATASGKPLDRRYVVRAMEKLFTRAGLPHFRFHDLRHSAGSLALAAGVHPKAVQEMLGHADFHTTMKIYAHVLPPQSRETANVMERILRKPAPSNLPAPIPIRRGRKG